jgi:hypothetical protein
MSGKYEKPLRLDLSLDEALRRFAQTDMDELPDNKKLAKTGRKKRPVPHKPTAADPADE